MGLNGINRQTNIIIPLSVSPRGRTV